MICTINDFKIIEKIGEGSFGTVYLALFKPTGERVALKRTRKDGTTEKVIERFKREAHIMLRVQHPSAVRFFGAFETETSLFIVMEYVEGKTLSSIVWDSSRKFIQDCFAANGINRNVEEFLANNNWKEIVPDFCGALPESNALRHFVELASILKHLHREKKVVHRDIKLENIIIDPCGHLRLIDFGFSNIEGSSNSSLFETACGTVNYAAPEVIKRELYSHKVDVWSSGIILYAMVTGKLPFFHENLQETYRQIVNDEPCFPSHLSPQMVELISLLLTKSPEKRPSFDQIFNLPIMANAVQEYSDLVNFLLYPPGHDMTVVCDYGKIMKKVSSRAQKEKLLKEFLL
ncbi:AGC family protein kinase [Tritrichomonas foetus]|uniref:AGC family protein kinase n=1 Tax=Tritrichomonas foetus TaxID=1144522 RepID=A0A1J4KE36_9EUKA|nr:AGC family protein kinase [Tritrichomonas foetus]|eukprot:OHT07725.1 AGC family protein kinase [Tritrichomonas foetus]